MTIEKVRKATDEETKKYNSRGPRNQSKYSGIRDALEKDGFVAVDLNGNLVDRKNTLLKIRTSISNYFRSKNKGLKIVPSHGNETSTAVIGLVERNRKRTTE